jgi:hypothetical protein
MTNDSAIRRQVVSRSVAPLNAPSHRTRFDPIGELLTFLLICPVCSTEKVIESLHYKPRFRPLPATGATVHRRLGRRDTRLDDAGDTWLAQRGRSLSDIRA